MAFFPSTIVSLAVLDHGMTCSLGSGMLLHPCIHANSRAPLSPPNTLAPRHRQANFTLSALPLVRCWLVGDQGLSNQSSPTGFSCATFVGSDKTNPGRRRRCTRVARHSFASRTENQERTLSYRAFIPEIITIAGVT